MKEYITIKNLGPLHDIERMEIRRFTFLIGESGIGKSTLMKVMAMMRYIYKMANIRSYLKQSKVTVAKFRLHYSTLLNNAGFDSYVNEQTYIEYNVVADSGNEYSITCKGSKMSTLPTIHKNDLSFYKVSYISENRNVIPMWTEKASMNAGASLGFYFNETNHDFSEATVSDLSLDLKYMGLSLLVSHPKSKPVKLTLTTADNRHGMIELRNASSGIQTSTPLVVLLNYFARYFSFKDAFKRSVLGYLHEAEYLTKFQAVAEPSELDKQVFVHVEEPELSLFPNAQCKMMDQIVEIANSPVDNRTVNIMLATHSPYILNYINVLLSRNLAEPHILHNEISVYRLSSGITYSLLARDENETWMVDTYDLTEDMNEIYNEYVSLHKS